MKLIKTIHDARGGRHGSPLVNLIEKTYVFSCGFKYMHYEDGVLVKVGVSFSDGYFVKEFTDECEADAYIRMGVREAECEEVYRY